MIHKLNKYLFPALFFIFAFTFFSRNDLRSVSDIDDALLKEPRQEKILSASQIQFSRNGFEYNLIPIYDYEISGLVAGKMNYSVFNIDKYDLVFPYDLCLTWGNNVARRLHQNKAVQFSQDCRWCWVNWSGNVNFNLSELSNNHLLINDDKVLRTVKSIGRGDQVRIRGKLVNVKARPTSKADTREITWNTSISRSDSGACACEVIYAVEVEILKRANALPRILFLISLYGLLGMIIWNVVDFFRP